MAFVYTRIGMLQGRDHAHS